MINVKPQHIRRVAFTSRLFPPTSFKLTAETSTNTTTTLTTTNRIQSERSKNGSLLDQLGFVKRLGCGSYAYLPLFMRTLNKLTNIVETQLEKLGALQVNLPFIIPQKWWIESKRLERSKSSFNDLFKLVNRNMEHQFLAPTHEETISKLVSFSKRVLSDKNLPLLLYQTTTKFRDEPRPRFGLLRTNEFIMNDMYSFDASDQASQQTYKAVGEAYNKIFEKLGLKCLVAIGESGSIGGSLSHEYQLPLHVGEDILYYCNNCDKHFNIVTEHQSLKCFQCDKPLLGSKELRYLELGHTFLLNTVYSDTLKVSFYDASNKSQSPLHMGCFGFGLSRVIGAGVELLSTSNNLRWPNHIEPFTYSLLLPPNHDEHPDSCLLAGCIKSISNQILSLNQENDILIHDKSISSIGKKLKEAQTIGIPFIIVLGGHKFSKDNQQIEYFTLNQDKQSYSSEWISIDCLMDKLTCNVVV